MASPPLLAVARGVLAWAAVTIALLLGGCHALLGFGGSGSSLTDRSSSPLDKSSSLLDKSSSLLDRSSSGDDRSSSGDDKSSSVTDERSSVDDKSSSIPDGSSSPVDALSHGSEGSTQRCATGAVQVAQLGPIVVCQGALKDACHAHELCNTAGNWYLCSGGQYQQQVGELTVIPPSMEQAWIKSCVFEFGSPHAPDNDPCPACANAPIAPVPASWHCATGAVSNCANATCGVMTHKECFAAGTKQQGNRSKWIVWESYKTLSRALCCQ